MDTVHKSGLRVAVKKCTPGGSKSSSLLSTGGKLCARLVEKMYPIVETKKLPTANAQLMYTLSTLKPQDHGPAGAPRPVALMGTGSPGRAQAAPD